MPTLGNVDVTIKSSTTGRTLEEYDSLKEPLVSTQFHVPKYIEAKTGETFSVEITLKPGFKYLKGADGISVHLKIDDGTYVDIITCYPREFEGIDQQAGAKYTISDFCTRQAGQIKLYTFGFTKLRMDEDLQGDNDTEDEQARTLGRISVRVSQVRRESCSPRERFPDHSSGFERHVEGSKALVKGKRVDHTMEPTQIKAFGDDRAPKMTTTRSIKMQEPSADLGTFHFYYRSRFALEVLGCNVDSQVETDGHKSVHSKPKVANKEATHPETAAPNITDELAKLRAENARLQRAVELEKEQNIEIKQEKRAKQALKTETMNKSSRGLMEVPDYNSGLSNKRRKVYNLTGDE